jgi:hypothetical protein
VSHQFAIHHLGVFQLDDKLYKSRFYCKKCGQFILSFDTPDEDTKIKTFAGGEALSCEEILIWKIHQS